jgi:hypothetical protein
MTRTRGRALRIAFAAFFAVVLMLAQATAALAAMNDASPASVACTTREVCDAVAALANLRLTVTQLVTDQGLSTSLTAKVDAATGNVLGGRVTPALNEVGAFENEVSDPAKILALLTAILILEADTAKHVIANVR